MSPTEDHATFAVVEPQSKMHAASPQPNQPNPTPGSRGTPSNRQLPAIPISGSSPKPESSIQRREHSMSPLRPNSLPVSPPTNQYRPQSVPANYNPPPGFVASNKPIPAHSSNIRSVQASTQNYNAVGSNVQTKVQGDSSYPKSFPHPGPSPVQFMRSNPVRTQHREQWNHTPGPNKLLSPSQSSTPQALPPRYGDHPNRPRHFVRKSPSPTKMFQHTQGNNQQRVSPSPNQMIVNGNVGKRKVGHSRPLRPYSRELTSDDEEEEDSLSPIEGVNVEGLQVQSAENLKQNMNLNKQHLYRPQNQADSAEKVSVLPHVIGRERSGKPTGAISTESYSQANINSRPTIIETAPHPVSSLPSPGNVHLHSPNNKMDRVSAAASDHSPRDQNILNQISMSIKSAKEQKIILNDRPDKKLARNNHAQNNSWCTDISSHSSQDGNAKPAASSEVIHTFNQPTHHTENKTILKFQNEQTGLTPNSQSLTRQKQQNHLALRGETDSKLYSDIKHSGRLHKGGDDVSMEDMRKHLDTLEAVLVDLSTKLGVSLDLIDVKSPERRDSETCSSVSNGSSTAVKRKWANITTFLPAKTRWSKRRNKDLKLINKRFQKLEAHVVTLARSVAKLTSEIQSRNSMMSQLALMREQLAAGQELSRQHQQEPSNTATSHAPESLQSLVQSGRGPLYEALVLKVRKLQRFFGQEPPLLQMMLYEMKYEIYIKVFEDAHIGVLELPLVNEEQLDAIGLPLGPRTRIICKFQGRFLNRDWIKFDLSATPDYRSCMIDDVAQSKISQELTENFDRLQYSPLTSPSSPEEKLTKEVNLIPSTDGQDTCKQTGVTRSQDFIDQPAHSSLKQNYVDLSPRPQQISSNLFSHQLSYQQQQPATAKI